MIEVDPERFEEMVASTLAGRPQELGQLMVSNVGVTVEQDAGRPACWGCMWLSCLPAGRSGGYAGVLPDQISIYRQAICTICRTEDEATL